MDSSVGPELLRSTEDMEAVSSSDPDLLDPGDTPGAAGEESGEGKDKQSVAVEIRTMWQRLRHSTRWGVLAIAAAMATTMTPALQRYSEIAAGVVVWVLALLLARGRAVDPNLVKAAALVRLEIDVNHPALYERLIGQFRRWRQTQRTVSRTAVYLAIVMLASTVLMFFGVLLIDSSPPYELPHAKIVNAGVFVATGYGVVLLVWCGVLRSHDTSRIRQQIAAVNLEQAPQGAVPPEDPQTLTAELELLRRLDERLAVGDATALAAARDMYEQRVKAVVASVLIEKSTHQSWVIGFVFFLLGALVSAVFK